MTAQTGIERRLPKSEARDENMSIGWITPTGYGAGQISRKVMRMMLDESPLMLVVDVGGYVFALDPISARAQDVEAKFPAWIVGIYTRACSREQMVGDMRERAREIKARPRA